jgi:myosin heavy subunit
MQYAGLFEAIGVRATGYPIRLTHNKFVEQYSICVPPSERKILPPSHDGAARAILKKLASKPIQGSALKEEDFPVGKSKVFMKVAGHNLLHKHREVALCGENSSNWERIHCSEACSEAKGSA